MHCTHNPILGKVFFFFKLSGTSSSIRFDVSDLKKQSLEDPGLKWDTSKTRQCPDLQIDQPSEVKSFVQREENSRQSTHPWRAATDDYYFGSLGYSHLLPKWTCICMHANLH